jgi:hypothetical protein
LVKQQNENKPIIIGNQPDNVYYKPILKELQQHDEVLLYWHAKNDANAEYVIKLLMEGAGLIVQDGTRGETETFNTVCKFKDPKTGMCTNPKIVPAIRCTEQVRESCKQYKQKYKNPITVNQIILEKVAQARR